MAVQKPPNAPVTAVLTTVRVVAAGCAAAVGGGVVGAWAAVVAGAAAVGAAALAACGAVVACGAAVGAAGGAAVGAQAQAHARSRSNSPTGLGWAIVQVPLAAKDRPLACRLHWWGVLPGAASVSPAPRRSCGSTVGRWRSRASWVTG